MVSVPWRRFVPLVAVVLVMVGLPALWVLTPLGDRMLDLVAWVQDQGLPGMVLFAVVIVVAAVAAVPASFGVMACGFLYGPWVGVPLAWTTTIAGGMLNFLVARHVLGRAVLGGWDESPLFQAVDGRLEEEGVTWTLMMRLSPVSPFHVVSYALGCTRVRPSAYLLGTALGCLPGMSMYALVGAGITDIARLLEGGDLPDGGLWVALGLTVVATVGITIRVRRVMRSLVAEAAPDAPEPPASP